MSSLTCVVDDVSRQIVIIPLLWDVDLATLIPWRCLKPKGMPISLCRLFAFLTVLMVGSMLQFFVANTHLEFVLSLAGAVLFSFFLIFDTHMIMHRVSPEDYITATIELYLDIINLFLHILRIVGEARRH